MNLVSTPCLREAKRKLKRARIDIASWRKSDFGTRNQFNREAWLERTLAEIPSGQRILDAGAGELQYRRFCLHLNYVSQDFAKYDGRGDRVGFQMGRWDQSQIDIVCDITNIPEPAASFDAIMCVEVLEHLPDPVRALKELTRLLKPGGVLIVTAPFCSLSHFSPYFFHTGFSRYFYKYWLGNWGYDILDLEWNGDYFEYFAQELLRLPSVAQQYAKLGPRRLERFAIKIVLRFLFRASQKQRGSEQLLAFGLHIAARKRTPLNNA